MRRLTMTAELRRFVAAREGATAIEYAMIAGGVAVAIAAAVTALGGQVLALFTAVSNLFS
jgi:pilus assembly protein Flp/PilA